MVEPNLPLRYVCQDETRLGLLTIPGRLITLLGVKPHGSTQWQRDNFYLYGVVEPLTGASYFYEFSHLDSDCFQIFIDQVSATFADSVVVMQMDRGSFHRSQQLEQLRRTLSESSSLLTRLNSTRQSRLWEHLKAQLRWSNCHTLDELRQQVTNILEQMSKEVIASLTGWNFITAAVLSASS